MTEDFWTAICVKNYDYSALHYYQHSIKHFFPLRSFHRFTVFDSFAIVRCTGWTAQPRGKSYHQGWGASPSQVCLSWCMQGTVVDVSSLFPRGPRDGWLPWNIMKYIHSFYTQQFLTRLLVSVAVLLWILRGRWKKLSITLRVVPVVQRNCWRELCRPRRAK